MEKGLKRSSEARLCVLPPGKGGSNCWWRSRCCLCCCCGRTSPSAGSATHSGGQMELLDSADDHRNNVSSVINRARSRICSPVISVDAPQLTDMQTALIRGPNHGP